jgi:mannose-6-phosphate isomerase
MRERAFPLWLEHGVDWKLGAFEEDLDPVTLKPRADFRRLRVTARQIYVFVQAERMGVARAADAVALGLAFLRNIARQEDGGYAMRFNRACELIDTTRDLYDHAFVLLAFAHAGERAWALEVLATIDEQLAHPAHGWRESHPEVLPRRQNPHMHLLEAVMAAYERFGETVFLDRADTIIGLFLDRFFQPDVPGLPEYYDDALVPVREGGRFVLEPGHHHEWVWLLSEYRRLSAKAGRTARPTEAAGLGLLGFAETHGVRPDGIVAAELWSDGRMKVSATRVWQHTERLKALSRAGTPADISAAMATLFRFFDGVPPGLWRERWADGFVEGDASPASTLYHITCALLEVQ